MERIPYLSIDIETTGLDIDCEILQIAAVYDHPDWTANIDNMKTFNIKIKHDRFISNPGAMVMNYELLKEIEEGHLGDGHIVTPKTAAINFVHFLRELHWPLTVAGKNVASFDLPRIERFIDKYHPKQNYNDFKWSHRTLDVGSLYFLDFGKIPSLSEINTRLGRPPVSHDALEDAQDVVHAIQTKLRENG